MFDRFELWSAFFSRQPVSEVSVCSLTLYNNVVAKCFEECVSEFRRRELDVGEEKVRTVHNL